MESDAELIYKILLPRVDFVLLKAFYYAIFNEGRTKFFAFTYNQIDKEQYSEASYYLNKLGTNFSYNIDSEKTKKYTTETSWHHKSTDECIDEGIYISYIVRFTGMFYESE